MYERILLPTDGHDGARGVVDRALELASLTGASIHALYVVDVGGVPDPDQEALIESLEAEGESALDRIAATAADSGVEATTAVRRGRPHEEIRAEAEATDADLIVMGTHGRSGLNRFLHGSVTEQVIRAGGVPVLAVDLRRSGRTVGSADDARAVAREALAEEGRAVEDFPEEVYRESGTWIVRARTEDGAVFNVHVNAATGEARTARIRSP